MTGGAFLDKATWTGFEIYNYEAKDDVLKITEADPMVIHHMVCFVWHRTYSNFTIPILLAIAISSAIWSVGFNYRINIKNK
jgi:hypothetical protein